MTPSPVIRSAVRNALAAASFTVVGTGMLLMPLTSLAAGQKAEKHFTVKGRPVVMIQNVANGRIEVKSWKNPEAVVSASQPSTKIALDTEQPHDRTPLTPNIPDPPAPQPP